MLIFLTGCSLLTVYSRVPDRRSRDAVCYSIANLPFTPLKEKVQAVSSVISVKIIIIKMCNSLYATDSLYVSKLLCGTGSKIGACHKTIMSQRVDT